MFFSKKWLAPFDDRLVDLDALLRLELVDQRLHVLVGTTLS